MVGGREFHRVGPEFLKDIEFREDLLEFREIRRGHFGIEDKIILYVFKYITDIARGKRLY